MGKDAWEGAGARRGQRTILQEDMTRSIARKATRALKGLPPRKRAPAQARREKQAAAGAAAAAANPPPEKRMKKGGGNATATATADDSTATRRRLHGGLAVRP